MQLTENHTTGKSDNLLDRPTKRLNAAHKRINWQNNQLLRASENQRCGRGNHPISQPRITKIIGPPGPYIPRRYAA